MYICGPMYTYPELIGVSPCKMTMDLLLAKGGPIENTSNMHSSCSARLTRNSRSFDKAGYEDTARSVAFAILQYVRIDGRSDCVHLRKCNGPCIDMMHYVRSVHLPCTRDDKSDRILGGSVPSEEAKRIFE